MIKIKKGKFKYPIGKCKSLHRDKNGKIILDKDQEKIELIGYSYFNVRVIDTETNTVRPTGEKEKVPTCLECYLFEKPIMEDRIAEEKLRYSAIIPYKWFWFYNEEDEKKYPNKDCNTIRKVPEYQEWQEKFKDCLSWDEKPF